MLGYALRRCGLSLAIVGLVMLGLFALLHLMPGDPAAIALGPRATPEVRARYAAKMHLDQPMLVQLGVFAGNILRGDLGEDLFSGRPVTSIVMADLGRLVFERHQRRAFAIAVSLVRDENDARELVQEAFLRVYRNLGSFEGGSSFFTWLYRIITNLSIDLIRKPGRQAVDPDAARESTDDSGEVDFPLVSRIDGADPVDVVRRAEIAGRLRQALDALPDYHRGVILMREVEGMSYEEIAESMGVSKGTVMSRLFHARQKLQRVLVDCYQEQVGRMPAKGGSDGADDERRFDASDDVTEEGQ